MMSISMVSAGALVVIKKIVMITELLSIGQEISVGVVVLVVTWNVRDSFLQ